MTSSTTKHNQMRLDEPTCSLPNFLLHAERQPAFTFCHQSADHYYLSTPRAVVQFKNLSDLRGLAQLLISFPRQQLSRERVSMSGLYLLLSLFFVNIRYWQYSRDGHETRLCVCIIQHDKSNSVGLSLER